RSPLPLPSRSVSSSLAGFNGGANPERRQWHDSSNGGSLMTTVAMLVASTTATADNGSNGSFSSSLSRASFSSHY
ncbi:hypothetical protein HN51_047497, partial [Arachis hypogaea]